jgi:hypothetical protein
MVMGEKKNSKEERGRGRGEVEERKWGGVKEGLVVGCTSCSGGGGGGDEEC